MERKDEGDVDGVQFGPSGSADDIDRIYWASADEATDGDIGRKRVLSGEPESREGVRSWVEGHGRAVRPTGPHDGGPGLHN